MSEFKWTQKRTHAALALADGKTQRSVAEELDIAPKTVYRWLQHPDFSAEVDRLTLMMGIASRAERLRIVKRVIAQRVQDDVEIHSEKDLLDWLKFAQGETDGIKLDLVQLASVYEDETPLARARQD